MNQTTAILGWGILIVIIAGVFYAMTGDGLPKGGSATNTISIENKTLTLGATTSETKVDAVKQETPMTQSDTNKTSGPRQVILKTNMGDITLELNQTATPNTVANFLKLAGEGFYNGVKFHRVIKGFMIQAGDPYSKDDGAVDSWGMGGPGYKFADELSGNEKYPQGTLAMANAGPNTNGSQFFIVTASPAAMLPPSYTVFGKVVSGLDVALKIENVATGASDRPVKPVIITEAVVK